MEIDRLDFAQEMQLRKVIRKGIKIIAERKKQRILEEVQQERQLRTLIRELITEATATTDNDPAPHKATGINVLEDLLKKIIPVIEADFKKLTSELEQRQSYRAHMVKAVEKTLAPAKVLDQAGEKDPMDLQEQEDIDVDVDAPENDEAFIDIEPEKNEEPEEPADPRDEFGIEGSEETGRNVAFDTFKKIGTNIVDAYDVLGSDEDKDLFYDYLITNLKLYFDKFESDLSTVEEPTTDEYEDQAGAGEEGMPV
jgi:hypothetical protein